MTDALHRSTGDPAALLAEMHEALHEVRDRLRRQDRLADHDHVRLLRSELLAMAASIQEARQEIAALRPPGDPNSHITTAAGELEAIVHTTQEAADQILTAAETLTVLSAELRQADLPVDLVNRLDEQTKVLLTACSFQDLTGQRTAKVLKTLRFIEGRVTAMVEIWGLDGVDAPPPPSDEREDAHLLNGPGEGLKQNAIDALFD